MVQIQRPSGVNVGVNNPGKAVYIEGNADTVNSWRLKVEGEHPEDEMDIEHFESLDETDITLTAASIAVVEADTQWTSNNHYYSSVLIDSRVDTSAPPALDGDMTGRILEWDGFVWLNFPDQWISKANFHNSVQTDRSIVRRLNIINTDPNDGTVYPPVPDEGLTLGSRFTNIDGNVGAHLSATTSDGVEGVIPFMQHDAGVFVDFFPPNQWATLEVDNNVVAVEYGNYADLDFDYPLGEPIVLTGKTYLAIKQGAISTGIANNLDHFVVQDRDQIMNAALTTVSGGIIINEAGNILRDFST